MVKMAALCAKHDRERLPQPERGFARKANGWPRWQGYSGAGHYPMPSQCRGHFREEVCFGCAMFLKEDDGPTAVEYAIMLFRW